jgi:hypothetical protein
MHPTLAEAAEIGVGYGKQDNRALVDQKFATWSTKLG